MQQQILTLCEFASEVNPGSLIIYKTFDVIEAKSFPWRANFYAVAKVNVLGHDTLDFKKVKMMILSAEDKNEILFTAEKDFIKEKNLERMNFIAGFTGLKFFHSGVYLYRITLDETIVVDYRFQVIQFLPSHI